MEMEVRVLLRALNVVDRNHREPRDGIDASAYTRRLVEDIGSMVADFLYVRGRSDCLRIGRGRSDHPQACFHFNAVLTKTRYRNRKYK